MSPENFCYWLRGKFENREDEISSDEIQSIKNCLDLVFEKKIPKLKEPENPQNQLPFRRSTDKFC